MPSRQTVLLPTQAQVVHSLVDHDGSVEDAVVAGELHHVILDTDEGDELLTGDHVAEVPDVPLLGSWSSVVLPKRIEVTSGPLAVV